MLIPTGAGGIAFDQRLPISPAATKFPSSSTILASKPGMIFPLTPVWPHRTVRDHHLQSFRGTERIQDLNAKSLFEALKQRGRQRLAAEIAWRTLERSNPLHLHAGGPAVRHNSKAPRRTKSADSARCRHRQYRGGTCRGENRRCPAAQWKIAGIPQTVGKK